MQLGTKGLIVKHRAPPPTDNNGLIRIKRRYARLEVGAVEKKLYFHTYQDEFFQVVPFGKGGVHGSGGTQHGHLGGPRITL